MKSNRSSSTSPSWRSNTPMPSKLFYSLFNIRKELSFNAPIFLGFFFRHESEMLQLKLKQKNLQPSSGLDQQQQLDSTQQQQQADAKIHSYFHLCKAFVHQMGLLSWEKRQSFNLLRKTPQLLRELKSLDDQTW